MTSLSKKLLFIVIPALVIIMGLLGALLVLPDSGSGKLYVEQISEARKLRESGEYQKAIIYYQRAIEKDDTKEESYLELATVYFLLNMRDEALKTLREGISKTNSIKLTEELERYEGMDNIDKFASVESVAFNTTYTDVFASYNYEKYTKECTVKDEQIAADCYTVVYGQYDASFEYQNSADNAVLDSSAGKPYPYARPTAIKMNKLGQVIIGVENGITVDDLKAQGASNVNIQPFNKELNTCLVTFEYGTLKFTVGCDESGNIKGENIYNIIVPKPGESTEEEKLKFTGKIIDSTTGENVSNVSLKIRSGKDNKTGDTVASETFTNGDYSVEREPGDYTVEVSAEGYNQEFVNIFVSDNDTDNEQTISISPTLAANEIRFVLEWGTTPTDLDSHLTGECKTGNGKTVNVNWTNKKTSSEGKTIAELDLDDVDGHGPETTTLYDTNGKYEYRVHNYSRNGELSNSGATVKIYVSGSAPIVVNVPNDVSGDWWSVCKIEDGKVTDINGAS